MARLSMSLLGPFQVTLGGDPVTSFKSNKARALLAYLAVERERPHRRDSLAALLWPDWPDRAARRNLRQTLANLRSAIGDRRAAPPYLWITRETIQFNSASDYWLDVEAFHAFLEGDPQGSAAASDLEGAVALYRGPFLEGFFVKGCPAFEDWALLVRERLHRQILAALHRLAAYYQRCGEYERACAWARRQVQLEPWQEESHQQLMRLLALSGQRSAALAQYEICHHLLAEELGVEPAKETTALYEQIRDEMLPVPVPSTAVPHAAIELPSFLAEVERPEVQRPLVVARESELAQLTGFLDLAMSGQGRVAFVSGEAGSGKTALLQEFTRRAPHAHPDLLIAAGNGNAHTGIGDSYLPFREVLQLLSGDVQAQWAAGAIGTEHARRLWHALPLMTQALLEHGPDLIDTLVPATPLVERLVAYGPIEANWPTRLVEWAQTKATGVPAAQRSELFQQYSKVVQALARQRPLLLVLDDLQWADGGSINLLFHLARQLSGHRILIIGAYRPEEVASGRRGQRHPLQPVINELQRQFGNISVDLDQAEGRTFIEAILDSEPNQLNPPFRDMLYRQTRGHPLFTIELLRGMQERGDLIQDKEGRWVEGPSLDWQTLPPRVEAVIAERIGRLPQPLQETLRVASVEGEVFTAEVVARAQGDDEREIMGRLSAELGKLHRLVTAHSFQRVGSQHLSRYRFRHILFQKYLYEHLDVIERAHLHEAIGDWLEALYQERVAAGETLQMAPNYPAVAEGAVHLARHFEAAGAVHKAAQYRLHAGIRAGLLSASEEAVAHLQQGLQLLQTHTDTAERRQLERMLYLVLAGEILSVHGPLDPQVERVHERLSELCQRTDEVPPPLLNSTLWRLEIYFMDRADYSRATQIAEKMLDLARRVGDHLWQATAHLPQGWIRYLAGDFTSARNHLQRTIDFCWPARRSLAFVDKDGLICALYNMARVLWFLGYPDQAAERSHEALAVAQELGHAGLLAEALENAGAAFHFLRHERQAAREHAETLLWRSAEGRWPLPQAAGEFCRAWTQRGASHVKEVIKHLQTGLAASKASGQLHHRSCTLAWLAEAHLQARQAGVGLSVMDEAFAFVSETGERCFEAELHRLKGELLRLRGDDGGAEASFREAINVARQQQAKSWELRATMSLSRLLQAQGKQEEGRQLLAKIYSWFTEGFDTPDLQDAKALLDNLT